MNSEGTELREGMLTETERYRNDKVGFFEGAISHFLLGQQFEQALDMKTAIFSKGVAKIGTLPDASKREFSSCS